MMSSEDYQFKLEQKMIREFETLFHTKTGKKITVLIQGRRASNGWMPTITLSELEKHILLFMSPRNPEDHYDLKAKGRQRSMVQLRMVFSQMARTFGYTYKVIGKYLNRDHTTVIHNVRTSANLIDVGDEIYLELFNGITDYLKEYYKHESDETLPTAGKVQDNPEPVVLD